MNGVVAEKILSKIYDVLVRIEKHILKKEPKKAKPKGERWQNLKGEPKQARDHWVDTSLRKVGHRFTSVFSGRIVFGPVKKIQL